MPENNQNLRVHSGSIKTVIVAEKKSVAVDLVGALLMVGRKRTTVFLHREKQ